MKYRNQGISPDHTLSIHLTKQEKINLKNLQTKLIKKHKKYVSLGEIARAAIINKIDSLDLKNKKLKRKNKKPVRISITATKKLFRDIKLAAQESEEKTISDFMRNAIFEFYRIK